MQDDDFEDVIKVVKVMPNGDALTFSKKKGGRKPTPGAKKRQYEVVTSRNHVVSQGESPRSLHPEEMDDVILPFPTGPVSVGSSWKGRLKLDQFGSLPQTCTVTKIAQKSGSVCAWLSFKGDASFEESSSDVKPTYLSFQGQAIFDITRGRFLKTAMVLKAAMKGPQTLSNGL